MNKHGWSGACAPNGRASCASHNTFSVGVFENVPRSSGSGWKRGKVKVRIIGSVIAPEVVYSKAQQVVEWLNSGTYDGPKTIKV